MGKKIWKKSKKKRNELRFLERLEGGGVVEKCTMRVLRSGEGALEHYRRGGQIGTKNAERKTKTKRQWTTLFYLCSVLCGGRQRKLSKKYCLFQ